MNGDLCAETGDLAHGCCVATPAGVPLRGSTGVSAPHSVAAERPWGGMCLNCLCLGTQGSRPGFPVIWIFRGLRLFLLSAHSPSQPPPSCTPWVFIEPRQHRWAMTMQRRNAAEFIARRKQEKGLRRGRRKRDFDALKHCSVAVVTCVA